MITQLNVRRNILNQRKNLSQSYIDIQQPLFNQKILKFCEAYSSIGLYSAMPKELSVDCCFQLSDRINLSLPRINQDDLVDFVNYEAPSLWRVGRYDILEPTTSIIDYVPEVFLVPLVAIDSVGTRIGMGKGYYDRFLQNIAEQTILVGVGWDFQLLEGPFVRQSHDIAMDYFISPAHCIRY